MKRKNRQALRAFVTALFLAVVLVLPGYPGMETIVRAASPESLETADAAAEEEKQEINMETEADSAESPALAEEESPKEQETVSLGLIFTLVVCYISAEPKVGEVKVREPIDTGVDACSGGFAIRQMRV